MKKKDNFIIPDAILSQLNEVSAGGFILFTLDEDGNPVLNSCFDSQAHAMGMHAYIRQWSEAIERINMDMTLASLLTPPKTRKK